MKAWLRSGRIWGIGVSLLTAAVLLSFFIRPALRWNARTLVVSHYRDERHDSRAHLQVFESLSNLCSSTTFQTLLASNCHLKANEMYLDSIDRVRSTSLFAVNFHVTDEESAQLVARNVASLISNHFGTNGNKGVDGVHHSISKLPPAYMKLFRSIF